MRFRTTALIVIFAVATCARAHAQTSGATDNELYAGYCMGVARGAEQTGASNQQSVRDRRQDQSMRTLGAVMRQQMIGRFSGYLLGTGVLTDPLRTDAAIGVMVGMNSGQSDEQQCTATMAACYYSIYGPPGAPLPKDSRAAAENLGACNTRDAACIRVVRCLRTDNLPF